MQMQAIVEREVRPGISRGLTFLFAVTGGAAVGNLYWAQPLLAEIASALRVSPAVAGSSITATQLGYAAGVLLLVPLGDTLNRQRLIPAVMAVSSLALLASAMAPSFGMLLGGLAAVGLTTVSGQLLLPLAGDLATDEERGRVVGSIVSGLLTGILLSRTISGLLGNALGWRAIYFAASAITLVLAGVLAWRLPPEQPRGAIAYGRLLSTIADVVRRNRAVQITLLLGACGFAVFTMFWTGLTFLLSAPPFSFSVTQIGLMGLVGLAGALAARRAGRLHDRGWSVGATGAAIVLTLLSISIAAAGLRSIALILIAVLLIDIGIQGMNVLNQTRLFAIDPASRSRLNTAFVVCNFIGGSIGSALAGLLWEKGGWLLVMAGEAVLTLVALTAWTLGKAVLEAAVPRPARA